MGSVNSNHNPKHIYHHNPNPTLTLILTLTLNLHRPYHHTINHNPNPNHNPSPNPNHNPNHNPNPNPHRRTGQHRFGGADRVLPEWIQWGGGGSSRNFPGSIFCGVTEFFLLTSVTDPKFMFFPVNCSNRPGIRVFQTCNVFSPNNVDSLPEFMSTNCPNWGGSCPPCPPVPYAYANPNPNHNLKFTPVGCKYIQTRHKVARLR